ncbi:MAG: MlaD family protein [Planctomycetota bacterium]
MSRVEPGYFKIGSFVLVGLALLTVGITVFGAGLFGGDRTYLETYFDESVQGLSKGSPVKYRGVQIGFVEEINFCRNKYALDPADANFEKHTRYVYTRVALYPTIFENFEDRTEVERTLADLVDRGLRTRLTSLGVTGTVYLEVDYFDVSLNPKLDVSWDPEHYYVPSSESTLLQSLPRFLCPTPAGMTMMSPASTWTFCPCSPPR